MLSTDPAATPSAQANGWNTAPPLAGDQKYVCPHIDLYPEQDSDLEALYDSPTDWEPVSYEDVLDVPSISETDLTQPIQSPSAVKTRVIERKFVWFDPT